MKQAVPLAVALQHPSNPKPQLIDLLSKLSHDADPDTALNAIFAMGILGAGKTAVTGFQAVFDGLMKASSMHR